MVPEWLRWALAALACYRLAQLIALDDGPADWLLRVRDWAGCSRYGEDGRPASSLGRLLACPYCLGVWFAAPCAGLALWPTTIGDVFLAVLGLAGAQAALEGGKRHAE